MRILFALLLTTLFACGDDGAAVCPTGTVPSGGACIAAPDGGATDASPDASDTGLDSAVDCDASLLRYRDEDGDTFGDPGRTMMVCPETAGWVDDATDCDDTTDAIKPGATELCDAIDNDCDTNFDEGLLEFEAARVLPGGTGSMGGFVMSGHPSGYLLGSVDAGDAVAKLLEPPYEAVTAVWNIPDLSDWLAVSTLPSGTQALAIYADSSRDLFFRVIDTDGGTVSDPLPFVVGADSIHSVNVTHVGERLFVSWVRRDDEAYSVQVAEFLLDSLVFRAEPRTVHAFVAPGIFVFADSPVAHPSEPRLFFTVVDRPAGELVTKAVAFSVDVSGAPTIVGEPVLFGPEDTPMAFTMMYRGFGGSPLSLLTVAGTDVGIPDSVGLDFELAESTSSDAIEFPEDLFPFPSFHLEDWLVITSSGEDAVGEIFLPKTGQAEGQRLSLVHDHGAIAQRANNEGALVYLDEADNRTFQTIGCTP